MLLSVLFRFIKIPRNNPQIAREIAMIVIVRTDVTMLSFIFWKASETKYANHLR